MGVGGNFWDALKPFARYEGFDYLRNKKIAVDLSFWIVQHQTAIQSPHVRKPHLRLTFFRTVNLFSKFGAYPVFVVDGKPSPLKTKARIARFYRFSGIDPKELPVAEEGVLVDRNKHFVRCVEECVDLLKLLGMPVFRASGEAEALCAQLNSEGFVHACLTSDSDAFLFGAKCVIKHVDPKSTGPLECYYVEDIEVGLGLRRKHLIAVSLLVGNDHNLTGVQGIGMETALRFIKKFREDEVLTRLSEVSSGSMLPSVEDVGSLRKSTRGSDKLLRKFKAPHCSLCGHPGNKAVHSKVPCEYCLSSASMNCSRKPSGFKCECPGCDKDRKESEHRKNESWYLRVCKKIATECNLSCNEIVELYLRNEDSDDFSAHLLWNGPDVEMLLDILACHLHWEPSYVRKQIFPMLSTIYLRDMAMMPSENLLLGQYKFDSIQRVKIRYGDELYVIRWSKSTPAMSNFNHSVSLEGYSVGSASEEAQMDEFSNGLDELNIPQIYVDGVCSYILSDENLELVQSAFPAEVDRFLKQKEVKEVKRRNSRAKGTSVDSQSPNPGGAQLSITDYYRSSKPQNQAQDNHGMSQNEKTRCLREKNKDSSTSLPKSSEGRSVSTDKHNPENDGNILRKYQGRSVSTEKDNPENNGNILWNYQDSRCSKKTLLSLLDSGYRVVTVSRGDEALATLKRKKRKVDLVLTRTKLPDMCAFQLVEILDTDFNMAVVMICDSYDGPMMLKGLESGAMFCLSLPLYQGGIDRLWQHAAVKRRNLELEWEAEVKAMLESLESSIIEDDFHDKKRKRSDLENVEGSSMGLPSAITWVDDLYCKFLEAVYGLGVDDVLSRMNVPGLTAEVVTEKLQQYCAYLKRQHSLSYEVANRLLGPSFANENPFMPGFLQNPQNQPNPTAFDYRADSTSAVQQTQTPPMELLDELPPIVPFPNPLQQLQAPLPFPNTAESSVQASCSSTVAEMPLLLAPPPPGEAEDEDAKSDQVRGG